MLAKTSATTARVVSVVVVVVAVVVAARWCWWWWVLGELQRNAASAQSPTPAIWVVQVCSGTRGCTQDTWSWCDQHS
jgi:hypothetical protein